MLTQSQLNDCKSYSDVCRLLSYPINGTGIRKAKAAVNNLNVDHFGKRRKNPLIEKVCPVCNIKFTTSQGTKKEKTVCSRACANTYFRSGEDHPNWSPDSYRTTCFLYHKKECVVCGENKIVEVHHNDGDHSNNDVINLIPLCPTHHQYCHSRYKNEVQPMINNYLNKFNPNP